jgi:SOS response regulatory protein OraA/RecX
MEVKTEETGINNSQLKIYIDNELWKTVRSLYFLKKMPVLVKSPDFKKKFEKLEKKKIINISLMLLSKRSYLKREWFSKMKLKLFTPKLLEEVFDDHLSPYFSEDEEVKRRIESYVRQGKGKRWIQQKMSPHLTMDQSQFQTCLQELCTAEGEVEKIREMESIRQLVHKKGRDKAIAFFLRRGFSFSSVKQALNL